MCIRDRYGEDAEYWGIVGLLHDIDFELYPEEHCLKAPEMLREAGVGEDVIHSVVSHGYGITVGRGVTIDVAPEQEMEKVLFAADELTGLIWAAALMRPSKSTKDMELKSLKKKYKSKGFAAGCSREVIERGAQQLGWELEKLLTMTLQVMADSEEEIQKQMYMLIIQPRKMEQRLRWPLLRMYILFRSRFARQIHLPVSRLIIFMQIR